MFCKKCGNKIEENSNFCKFCGAKMDKEKKYFNEIDNGTTILDNSVGTKAKDTSNDIKNDTGKHLSAGVIVALVLGIVLGVILIIILPIALFLGAGIHLTKKVTNEISADSLISTTLDTFKKENYNYSIEQHSGNSVSGSEVISLISEIVDSNLNNIGNRDKFISIEVQDISDFSLKDDLDKACRQANSIINKNAKNDEKNVKAANELFKYLRSKIDSSKNYNIKVEYDKNGYIYKVIVKEIT